MNENPGSVSSETPCIFEWVSELWPIENCLLWYVLSPLNAVTNSVVTSYIDKFVDVTHVSKNTDILTFYKWWDFEVQLHLNKQHP